MTSLGGRKEAYYKVVFVSLSELRLQLDPLPHWHQKGWKCCLPVSCNPLKVFKDISLGWLYSVWKIILYTLRWLLLCGQPTVYITCYRLGNILPLHTSDLCIPQFVVSLLVLVWGGKGYVFLGDTGGKKNIKKKLLHFPVRNTELVSTSMKMQYSVWFIWSHCSLTPHLIFPAWPFLRFCWLLHRDLSKRVKRFAWI